MGLRNLTTLPALLLLSHAAFGQSEVGSASLNGTVTDPSGGAIVGAKVKATNQDTGFVREAATNSVGLYNLIRVPVGAYELSVEAPGFKPSRMKDLRLAVGAVATVDVRLEVGATQESVTVSADVPLVESTRSQTSTVVDQRSVNDLPINGRNFLDFAVLTPGVTRDTRFGDLSFAGQRGTANSLLVDGGDSNNLFFGQSSGRAGTRNPYSFSQDAVQEFQVNASSYTAETGRAGAGVINVITKSGTNQMHGTGFWFYRDKAMNANTFINNSRGIPRQPYHFNQFGGNISGPIKKDKLFYFFNYDGQRNTNPVPVFFPVAAPGDPLSQQGAAELSKYLTPYTTKLDNNIYTAKVDWNINASNTLSVRYNAHRFHGVNFENSGSQSAAEHTGNSNVTTDNVAATYTRVISGSTIWDSRFIYLRDNEPGEANSSQPEAQVRQNNILVMTIGRNNFSPRYTNTSRYQTIQSISHVRGRHTYKFGADLNFERVDNFFPGNFSGSYQFNSYADFAARRAARFTQAFAGANTDGPLTQPHINEFAFFVQDAWRVSDRLTLNYGARYDLMDSADPKVKNPDASLAAWGIDTSRMNLDTNNFAGRFGFAYRVTQSNKLLLRGGWGMYYGRTPAILTGTAHSQNGIQVQTYSITTGLPTYPGVLSAPPAASRTPDIYAFASNYVQPLTHQWSFNVESELAPNWLVTVGYLGVRGMHLTTTRDVNLFPAIAETARFADGSPATIYRHPATRPNTNFGRISLFDSGQDSIYHGAFVQLTKRLSRNVQLLTSYTYSKVIDSVPEATSVVVGTGDDAKVAQDTLLPGLDRSVGDAHIPHRFVFSGLWDIDYARSMSSTAARAILGGYQLSLISQVTTGRWSSATVGGTSDVNRDANGRTDRPPSVGRNTLEGPGFAAVDMRFSKDIPFTERVKLKLVFEAFNLTNRSNFNNFNRTPVNFNATTLVFTPIPTFGQMTGSSEPRILQLAAKITF
jgi:hypothetical protein